MNYIERFFIRQRENRKNLRRLGVRYVFCIERDCKETDPRCFIGELSDAKNRGRHAVCALRRMQA